MGVDSIWFAGDVVEVLDVLLALDVLLVEVGEVVLSGALPQYAGLIVDDIRQHDDRLSILSLAYPTAASRAGTHKDRVGVLELVQVAEEAVREKVAVGIDATDHMITTSTRSLGTE